MIREVMPWKANDPSCVTVIRATEQRWATVDDRLVRVPYRLSKRITEDAVIRLRLVRAEYDTTERTELKRMARRHLVPGRHAARM